jgi:hypothetical protein
MYEAKTHRPISRARFAKRVLLHFAAALAVLGASLALGMVGYEYFENLAWRDAFLNAAMLAGGMGPVDAPRTNGGKVFAGLYALYAGLVFMAAAGLVFAPILHRLLHKFHWQPDR